MSLSISKVKHIVLVSAVSNQATAQPLTCLD